jgi:hypothetical protein
MTTSTEIREWFSDDAENRQRETISHFICDKRVDVEERLAIWRETPDNLATTLNYITDVDLPVFESMYSDFNIFEVVAEIGSKYQEVDLREVTGYLTEKYTTEELRALDVELMEHGAHYVILDW